MFNVFRHLLRQESCILDKNLTCIIGCPKFPRGVLRKVLQNRTPNRAPVRTLTGRIGGCKKGLKMAVCMEKCILFYWCWSQRLICSTLEPTFFILLKQTADMIFLNFFFLKSEVGWEGGVLHGYLDLFSHTPLPLGPTTRTGSPIQFMVDQIPVCFSVYPHWISGYWACL